ncbi:MAG: hypothetical protein U0610_08535 [bacterium]
MAVADPSRKTAESGSTAATGTSAAPSESVRLPADPRHALALFQELMLELRAARQREDVVTFGFAGLLVLLAAGPVLEAHPGPSTLARLVAVIGIALLGWRVNGFLAENRNRQNQIRKIVSITEHAYPFPTDRSVVRLSDIKNLDGPGEWDKSDYSLADWDRSEYSVFLKLLLVIAMFAVLVF